MPVPIDPQALSSILHVLQRFPEGAALDEVVAGLTPPRPARTVSRWLLLLVASGQVHKLGQSRNTRYRLADTTRAALGAPEDAPAAAADKADAKAASAGALSTAAATTPAPAGGRAADGRPDASRHSPEPRPVPLADQIFDAAIGMIVRNQYRAPTVLALLQHFAERNLTSLEERRGCVAVLQQRVADFSASEAEAHGFTPEQYRAWRLAYDGAMPTPSDISAATATAPTLTASASGETSPARESDTAAPPRDAAATPAPPASRRARLPRASASSLPAALVPHNTAAHPAASPFMPARAATPSAPAGGASTTMDVAATVPAATPANARPVSPDAAAADASAPDDTPGDATRWDDAGPASPNPVVAENTPPLAPTIGHAPGVDAAAGNLAALWRGEAFGDVRRLLAPHRLVVSAAWAAAVAWGAHAVFGAHPLALLRVPIAGVPALVFVDRDRNAVGAPLGPRGIATTLLAGGAGASLLGQQLLAVGYALLSGLW